MSVLQASATRRDAKNYLQKYAPQTSLTEIRQRDKTLSVPSTWSSNALVRAASEAPQFVQGKQPEPASNSDDLPKLAIVKLRLPQSLDDRELRGIARTLSQLRKLGLVSVVVLDAGPAAASRDIYTQQAHRLQHALDDMGPPGARIADHTLVKREREDGGFLPSSAAVQFPSALARALSSEEILILPPVGTSPALDSFHLIDPDDAIMALAKHFCGLQFEDEQALDRVSAQALTPGRRNASIERVIILDPLGAIPIAGQPGASHRFINLEQEFGPVMRTLEADAHDDGHIHEDKSVHVQNLKLLKNILSLLPATSTALISSPSVAATRAAGPLTSVATRNKLNPLIHNLLTDKPVFSSSLPLERVRSDKSPHRWLEDSPVATVVKRGMPLTIYPDPTRSPWLPTRPGSPRLRLTDTCIDLPRLQHLIEDSFDRKLDLRHYLDRINDNLAGVIIAGEYEGGAVLTWEKPSNMSQEEAYQSGRLVPYLDKFAVLKSRQGSGGVADVVFNAMVRGCFPDGVAWRSRKDNPVNKWYFERSVGTRKLKDTNWTMFWTTPNVALTDPKLRDYEDVCRHVEPSWADKKKAAD